MIKVGVFFGGVSREREISFSGAKTVSQTLNHSLFEPVYILVDSLGKFIKISSKQFDYKAIFHFYPSQEVIPEEYDEFSPVYIETLEGLDKKKHKEIIEQIGTPILAEDLSEHIDFALLMLHGTFAEDGMLQGLFEWLQIPYSGCGIFSSSFSIDKHLQKVINEKIRFQKSSPQRKYHMIRKEDWLSCNREVFFEEIKSKIGFPVVIKAPYQGSSIGVSILNIDDLEAFIKAVNSSLFSRQISKTEWTSKTEEERKDYIRELMSLEKGIGLPVIFEEKSFLAGNLGEQIIYSPIKLLAKLNDFFSYSDEDALLFSFESEDMVLFEEHLSGKEFSCGVIQDKDLKAVALPPTEIITAEKVYDFEAKYLPNASQKRIPIDIPTEAISNIQEICKDIFDTFKFDVCARIDGFYTDEGAIEIIDINTLPGMSPTSLIFRQASEIGLSPTDFMTYIIYQSLNSRTHTAKRPYFIKNLFKRIENHISEEQYHKREKVAILFDNQNLSRARKEFNEVASKGKQEPFGVYLKKEGDKVAFYQLPIAFLLKPSIEEIEENLKTDLHPAILQTIQKTEELRAFFVKELLPKPKKIDIEYLSDTSVEAVWLSNNSDFNKTKLLIQEVGIALVE